MRCATLPPNCGMGVSDDVTKSGAVEQEEKYLVSTHMDVFFLFSNDERLTPQTCLSCHGVVAIFNPGE